MEKKGEFKAMKIESMAECHQVVGNYIDKGVWFAMIIAGLIGLHFSLVIHTHWKNFGVDFRQQVDENEQPSEVEV